MIRILAIVLLLGLAMACSAPQSKSKSLVPTGLETSKAATERTRKTQESDETGAIYAASTREDESTASSEKTETTPEKAPEPSISLAVAADGTITGPRGPIESEALSDFFESVASSTRVIVRTSDQASHGMMVELMNEAKKAGITHIAFELEESEQETELADDSETPGNDTEENKKAGEPASDVTESTANEDSNATPTP